MSRLTNLINTKNKIESLVDNLDGDIPYVDEAIGALMEAAAMLESAIEEVNNGL